MKEFTWEQMVQDSKGELLKLDNYLDFVKFAKDNGANSLEDLVDYKKALKDVLKRDLDTHLLYAIFMNIAD